MHNEIPTYAVNKRFLSREQFEIEYPIEAKKFFKRSNMQDYKNYLEYRSDYKFKLSYHEYKKNHKHKFHAWKKRQWAIYCAKHFIFGCDPIWDPNTENKN